MKQLLVFILLISLFSRADTPAKKKGPPNGFSLGLGYIYSTSEYAGVGPKNLVMPFFTYKHDKWFIRGLKVSYNIFSSNIFKVTPSLDGHFFSGGYEPDDSHELNGMEERKGTAKLGLKVDTKLKKINLNLEIKRDILNRYHGYSGTFTLGSKFPISVLFKKMPFTMLGLQIGYKYYDSKYSNYYYGVNSNETKIGRPEFSAKSAFNPYLSCFLRVSLTKKWTWMNLFNIEWYEDNIKESPIVRKEDSRSFASFLSYIF